MAKSFHHSDGKKFVCYDVVTRRRLEALWCRFLGHMGEVTVDEMVEALRKVAPTVEAGAFIYAIDRAAENGFISPRYSEVLQEVINTRPAFDHAAYRRKNASDKTSGSDEVERAKRARKARRYLVPSQQDGSLGGERADHLPFLRANTGSEKSSHEGQNLCLRNQNLTA